MRHFTNVKDLGDLNIALKEAFEVNVHLSSRSANN